MRSILDIQHRGKPTHPRDRGAVVGTLVEVEVTHAYAGACDASLHNAGVESFVISDGAYIDRWKRANALSAGCYVACHANAGNGVTPSTDRAEIYHWPGSTRGQALAEAVAVELRAVVPWPVRVLPAGERQRGTIQGVTPPALCFEPGFLDGVKGRDWLAAPANVSALGVALARGIHHFLGGSQP